VTNQIERCTFLQCRSSDRGGGIYSSGASLVLVDCCVRSCWTGAGAFGQFLFADANSPVNLTNPSLYDCGQSSSPSATKGTVYLSLNARLSLSSPNFTACYIGVETGDTDGVTLFLSGSGSPGDACKFGTFDANEGRTLAHGEARTGLTYSLCNFVSNSCRQNLLYQSANGRATLNSCIFLHNSASTGFLGMGVGKYTVVNCAFDFTLSASVISSSTHVVYTNFIATNTLWHLNTGLCLGFRTPSQVFEPSPRFGATRLYSRSLASVKTGVLLPTLLFFSANLFVRVTHCLARSLSLSTLPSVCRSLSLSTSPSVCRSFLLELTQSHGESVSFSIVGHSELFSDSLFASSVNDHASGSSLLIPVLLPILSAVLVIAIGSVIFLRLRRSSEARSLNHSSDSNDEDVKTVDFCTDSGLTVSSTLTMTLTESNDLAWARPAASFNSAGFGLQS
jgi:hypothetical protein